MQVTRILQDGATSKEAMVLIRPLPPGDLLPWLSVLFGPQLLALESRWKPSQIFEKPGWMIGKSLVLAEPIDYVDQWQSVRAACHAADEGEPYHDALVHLYTLARQTFRSQPLRRFMYGVLIVESTFELWAFYRSGMYVAQPLDLRADYLDAVSIIVGLSLMLPKELGANNLFPKYEHTEAWHTPVLGEALELRKAAAITPEDVFGYGMLCYYARKQNEEQWSHVIKFKWRTSFKSEEEEIFKVVQENGITNVPSLVRHDRLGSTAELRDGLHHQAYRNLLESGVKNRDKAAGSKNTASHQVSHFATTLACVLSSHPSDFRYSRFGTLPSCWLCCGTPYKPTGMCCKRPTSCLVTYQAAIF
ncbi:serine/threonine-protein kinase Sgk2 [Akanthomyces lecanii RCEF 1005]|uniref:Serine/threonine-protein kinase Sgk2 n=1 Tax=Akanthomyces lecanii RCEF 1005 TaxID=1081108 RepID=A0A167YJU4_CORDF|nr:serine/threonine-protein kinase Sgk2 [Akanthomyces lecanii RCEF 1005]